MTSPGRLDVDVEGLRSSDGLIQACLTRQADHFPDCDGDPNAVRRTIRANAPDSLAFANLPSGSYALSIIHDENANDRLDRFAGIPREGIGFSRNPAFTFGPPRFSAARFAVSGAEAITVRMRYFL
ncbi:MAG: DUF2141 domain-containing protein [Sphingomonadaceae bacterium]|nr:DUF2141 domain-containing protein [Sphingomonadaceae bacterium]